MKIRKTGIIVNEEKDKNLRVTKKIISTLNEKNIEVYLPQISSS